MGKQYISWLHVMEVARIRGERGLPVTAQIIRDALGLSRADARNRLFVLFALGSLKRRRVYDEKKHRWVHHYFINSQTDKFLEHFDVESYLDDNVPYLQRHQVRALERGKSMPESINPFV